MQGIRDMVSRNRGSSFNFKYVNEERLNALVKQVSETKKEEIQTDSGKDEFCHPSKVEIANTFESPYAKLEAQLPDIESFGLLSENDVASENFLSKDVKFSSKDTNSTKDSRNSDINSDKDTDDTEKSNKECCDKSIKYHKLHFNKSFEQVSCKKNCKEQCRKHRNNYKKQVHFPQKCQSAIETNQGSVNQEKFHKDEARSGKVMKSKNLSPISNSLGSPDATDDNTSAKKTPTSGFDVKLATAEELSISLQEDARIKIGQEREKIGSVIAKILNSIDKVPVPDGIDDMQRRLKRANEFACRFSRNYLYEMNWQMSDLKSVSDNPSLYIGGKNTAKVSHLFQKLIMLHQTIHKALLAYLNHMPSSVRLGAGSKLKQLLEHLNNLSDICVKLSISQSQTGDCIDDMEIVCQNLIIQINECSNNDEEELETENKMSRITLMNTNKPVIRTMKKSKKHFSSADLSMYYPTNNLRVNFWEKTSALARVKFGPIKKRSHLKGKKSTRLSRRETTESLHSKAKKNEKIDSKSVISDETNVTVKTKKKKPKDVSDYDSDGKTLMQKFLPDIEEKEEIEKSADSLKGTDSKCSDRHCHKKVDEIDFTAWAFKVKNELQPLMEQLKEALADPKKGKSVQQDGNSEVETKKSCSTIKARKKRQKDSKSCTNFNAENAKLFVMYHSEDEDDYDDDSGPTTKDKKGSLKKLPRNTDKESHQPNVTKKSHQRKSKLDSCTNMQSQFYFSKVIEFKLPERISESVKEYQRKFQRYRKKDPLYRDSKVKPWDVIGCLANKLLCDLLNEILEESQNIVPKILEQEFTFPYGSSANRKN